MNLILYFNNYNNKRIDLFMVVECKDEFFPSVKKFITYLYLPKLILINFEMISLFISKPHTQ